MMMSVPGSPKMMMVSEIVGLRVPILLLQDEHFLAQDLRSHHILKLLRRSAILR